MIASIDVKTKDNKIYSIPDINIFSKYPESTMWQMFTNNDLDMFILSYLTYETLDAIVVFHERNIWPHKPRIANVHDPFDFLDLPRFPTAYNSEDEDNDEWWNYSDNEYDY